MNRPNYMLYRKQLEERSAEKPLTRTGVAGSQSATVNPETNPSFDHAIAQSYKFDQYGIRHNENQLRHTLHEIIGQSNYYPSMQENFEVSNYDLTLPKDFVNDYIAYLDEMNRLTDQLAYARADPNISDDEYAYRYNAILGRINQLKTAMRTGKHGNLLNKLSLDSCPTQVPQPTPAPEKPPERQHSKESTESKIIYVIIGVLMVFGFLYIIRSLRGPHSSSKNVEDFSLYKPAYEY